MKINERIERDSVLICELELCQLRLIKDELDWFILLPRGKDLVEIIDLKPDDRLKLMNEISYVSKLLMDNGDYDKQNIGSLGNIVSQLHIHIIGRKKNDRAWPNAIWGTKTLKPFNISKINYWKNLINKNSL